MRFSSTQIKGKGRGKLLGFPTINLEIPKNFGIKEGIYAVKVWIKKEEFAGALHFGPIPTFKENEKTLEVFLIDTANSDIPPSDTFDIETIKYLRPVLSFSNPEDLSKQISEDVITIRKILNLS